MFVCARLLGWGESPVEKPPPRSRHLLVAPQQDVQHNFRIPQHVPPLPCVRGCLQTTRHQPLCKMPQKPRRQLGIDIVGVYHYDLRVGFFGMGCDQRCRQTNIVGLDSENFIELFHNNLNDNTLKRSNRENLVKYYLGDSTLGRSSDIIAKNLIDQ